jgi:hypothetical protein
MVRDHQRAFLEAEAPQPVDVARIEQRPVVLREDDALIAPLRRVPLEAEEGAERTVAISSIQWRSRPPSIAGMSCQLEWPVKAKKSRCVRAMSSERSIEPMP